MSKTVGQAPGIDLETIGRTWADFEAASQLRPVRPVRDEADYDRMVSLMNALIDRVGDDVSHPLAGLLDLVGELVSSFEGEHYALPAGALPIPVQFSPFLDGTSSRAVL